MFDPHIFYPEKFHPISKIDKIAQTGTAEDKKTEGIDFIENYGTH